MTTKINNPPFAGVQREVADLSVGSDLPVTARPQLRQCGRPAAARAVRQYQRQPLPDPGYVADDERHASCTAAFSLTHSLTHALSLWTEMGPCPPFFICLPPLPCPPSRPSLAPSLAPSHTHSLSLSVDRSLSCSLTLSLSHALNPSRPPAHAFPHSPAHSRPVGPMGRRGRSAVSPAVSRKDLRARPPLASP